MGILSRRIELPGWAEFLLGLALGAVMAMLFYTPRGYPRELAYLAACGASLNGIGKEIALYRAEYRQQMPPDLYSLVANGLNTGLFVCPGTGNDEPVVNEPYDVDYQKKRVQFMADSDYVYVRGLDQRTPAEIAMVFELPANHYQEEVNLLHADGSVSRKQIPDMLAQLQAALNHLRSRRDSFSRARPNQGSNDEQRQ
jgi:hypothetical protein